jgi:hypothetical protein
MQSRFTKSILLGLLGGALACGGNGGALDARDSGASSAHDGGLPVGSADDVGSQPFLSDGGGQAGTDASTPASNGACGKPELRISEVDVGMAVVANEDEAALKPLAITPVPSGGSRLAWLGGDGNVHVTTLAADDTLKTGAASVSLKANDFADVYGDDAGGVVLLTRPAQGGGTLNCGEPTNLCGTPPSPAVPCYDMYLVRFDGASETWATQLTQASATHPPYLTSKTDATNITYIWWYAHHGRIASDGSNFAAYYGAAISVSQSGCINIHQGDQMRVVNPSGQVIAGGFDWGCSHSGYERVLFDASTKKFVTVCKNDAPTAGKSGRLAFAPATKTLYPVDLNYANVSNVVLAKGGGYWIATSDLRAGQPAGMNGLADVHLLHFSNAAPDKDLVIASTADLNQRAPHLASYGAQHLLAAWESSSAKGDLAPNDSKRKLVLQVRDAQTGEAVGDTQEVAVKGNRYYELRAFPDGSVAYAAPGTSNTKVKILRVLPCL